MADFNPKFVDLVRNYTTTSGTSDFVLGPAVNGFTGFTAALQPGDRFHYACLSADKPAEREIGRGTLTADGRIQREAVSGSKTVFGGGTKSIALIAAAEWFGSIGPAIAAIGGTNAAALQGMATRATLAGAATSAPMFLKEARREGVFAFDASDFQARFGASLAVVDPNQALFVAPPADLTGASGAWVRADQAIVRPQWWGAWGDDKNSSGHNDGAVFAAMLTTLAFVSDAQRDTAYLGGPTIELGAHCYYLGGTTLDFTFTAIMRGAGSGMDGGVSTRLRWASGATGIRVQRYNTSGAAGFDTVTHRGGDGCVFRGLCLQGNFSTVEGEYHGFHLRGRAKIDDCYVVNFQGDGIRIWASQGNGAGGVEGNANLVQINHASLTGNRNGIFADGADSNAGCWIGVNCQSNRAWGIYDGSFLGNHLFGCHFDANGIDKSLCHYSSKRYQVVPGQEAGASTNPPSGTSADNAWWRYIANGGSGTGFTAWTSGLSWRAGGHYFTDSTSGSLSHSYLEGGYGYSYSTGINSAVWGCFGGGDGIIGTSFSAHQAYGFYAPGGIGTKGVLISETLAQFNGSGLEALGGAPMKFKSGNTSVSLGFSGYGFRIEPYNQTSGLYENAYTTAAAFKHSPSDVDVWESTSAGFNLKAGTYKINGVTVIDAGKNALFANVTASGTVSASNVSGTNSGDQFVAVASGTIVGRSAAGSGAASALTTATVKGMLALSAADVGGLAAVATSGSASDLNAGTIAVAQTAALTGDVTKAAGSGVTAIAANAVSFAKLQQVATVKLLGNPTGAAANATEIGLAGGLAFSGTNLSLTGAITSASSITISGLIKSSHATGGVGYSTGAGGAVTQATDKSTGVTLNRVSGQVTMNAAALAASASVSFVLTNSAIAATDMVGVTIASGATSNAYLTQVEATAAGSCRIQLRNISAASLAEAVVLNIAVLKGVAA